MNNDKVLYMLECLFQKDQTNACAILNSNNEIVYMNQSDDSIKNAMLSKNLFGCKCYTTYLPEKNILLDLKVCGVVDVIVLFNHEDVIKYKLKLHARKIIQEKEDKIKETRKKIEENYLLPNEVYRVAAFLSDDTKNSYLKCCNVNDDFEFHPDFLKYITGNINLKKINIDAAEKKHKFIFKNLKGLNLRFRIAMIKTEDNAIDFVAVKTPLQHQSLEESPNFIKWQTKWNGEFIK